MQKHAFKILAAVCLILAVASPASAAGTTLALLDHNVISAPFPRAYSKDTLDKIAEKNAALAKAKQQAKQAKQKKQALPPAPVVSKIEVPSKRDLNVEAQLTRTSPGYDTLVDRLASATRHSDPDSRWTTSVGYGKVFTGDSAGMDTGTRISQPGCVYVKKQITF